MKTSDFRIGDIVSVDNLTECKVIEIKEKHIRVEYIREDTQLPHRPLIEIERISPVKLSQDKNLSDTLNAIFNSGHSIRFQNVVRRKEGEWYNQIIWEHVQQPTHSVIKRCDWFGFETIEEAADDCLTYLAILNIE